VVDKSAQLVQRNPQSQADQARVLTYGQLGLWMGSCPQRTPHGTRILPRILHVDSRRGRTTTHYMETIEGRPSRRRELLAAVGRPQRPYARRQPGSPSHYDKHNVTISRVDGRTKASLVRTLHEQRQPTRALRSIISQRMGRQTKPTPKKRRDEI
jgi:hypothetical protein